MPRAGGRGRALSRGLCRLWGRMREPSIRRDPLLWLRVSILLFSFSAPSSRYLNATPSSYSYKRCAGIVLADVFFAERRFADERADSLRDFFGGEPFCHRHPLKPVSPLGATR